MMPEIKEHIIDDGCPKVSISYAHLQNEPVLPRKALLEVLEDRAEPVQLLQNRPYTCVQLRTWYNGKEYLGFGFSKVMWPDQWDAEDGADIAMRHALIMVMHQIRADEERK